MSDSFGFAAAMHAAGPHSERGRILAFVTSAAGVCPAKACDSWEGHGVLKLGYCGEWVALDAFDSLTPYKMEVSNGKVGSHGCLELRTEPGTAGLEPFAVLEKDVDLSDHLPQRSDKGACLFITSNMNLGAVWDVDGNRFEGATEVCSGHAKNQTPAVFAAVAFECADRREAYCRTLKGKTNGCQWPGSGADATFVIWCAVNSTKQGRQATCGVGRDGFIGWWFRI